MPAPRVRLPLAFAEASGSKPRRRRVDIRLHEKGDHRRTIGLHYAAAQAIREYIDKAGISPSRGASVSEPKKDRSSAPGADHVARFWRSDRWTRRRCTSPCRRTWSMLPGATKDGRCVYTPHSLRATTATLLLDSGVDITNVQDLLGHRHITTTQIYDKRRRTTSESASHDVPI